MHPTFEDKLEEIRVNSHVSPFLHFYDDHLCREYQKFKVSQSNKYAYIPLHLAAIFFHLTGSYRGMMISFDFINVLNFILCFIFTMFIGTWLIVVHNKNSIYKKGSKMWKDLDATYTSALESVWIIGGAVCLSMVPVTLAANGLCGEGQSHVASGCNYSGDVHEIPMDITMALFFAPIIHAVVLQGASFFSVVVAIVINCSVLFTVMYLYSMSFRGPIIMLFCPLCLLVMYEFQRQGISMFLLSQKQEIMMDEIERLSSQSGKELRSMIGNVAHDLKTVRLCLYAVVCDSYMLCSAHQCLCEWFGLCLHSAGRDPGGFEQQRKACEGPSDDHRECGEYEEHQQLHEDVHQQMHRLHQSQ